MGTLIGLATLFWKPLLGAVLLLAGVLGIKGYGASRKKAGAAEARIEIATHNAAVQQQMAQVERPTPDEAVRRLGDGTA